MFGKEKAISFCSFSWETNLIDIRGFYAEKRKIGKEPLYLTKNQLGRKKFLYGT